jgi:hypothetical protein
MMDKCFAFWFKTCKGDSNYNAVLRPAFIIFQYKNMFNHFNFHESSQKNNEVQKKMIFARAFSEALRTGRLGTHRI